MKYLRIALACLPLLALHARADEDEKDNAADEIPDFSNLDDFVYQPKSNATIGMRYISGAKTSFFGNGSLAPPELIPDPVGTGFDRYYHDGYVDPDGRTETVTYPNGTTGQVPIQPDGKTNNWSYDTNAQENAAGTGTTSQVTADDYMQFHIYAGTSDDNIIHDHPGKGSTGVELQTRHDLGRIGKHVTWSLFSGVTLNDIESSMFTTVKSTTTTWTDTYDLFGQTVPPGPYTAPSQVNQNIISNGQVLVNSAGDPITESVDTTVLIGSQPLSQVMSTSTDFTSMTDHFKLHGGYLTFRGGPALTFNLLNDHLKLIISAGPALIDASSTYTVTEVLTPPTGAEIIGTWQDIEDHLVPAAYLDATMEYDLTERAGLYFGAYYQIAGHYTQTVDGYAEDTTASTGNWSTKVDFSDQEGLRGGLSFKF